MKILKITSWYPNPLSPLSGSFVEDQALALARNGINVGVLYVEMDLRKVIKKIKTHHFKTHFKEENGVKVFRYYGFFFPKITKLIYLKWIHFFDTLLQEYIKKYGFPDVLHAHNYQSAYAAHFLSKKYQIPFIVTEHSSFLLTTGINGWRRQILKESFRNASKIISVSEGLKALLTRYVNRDIVVIPNLINTDLFSIKNEKIINEKFQIIAAGDLIPRKGFHLLIEAFSLMDPFLKKNMCLKIFGQGPEKTKLVSLIKKLREDKRILLKGEVSRDVIAKEMKNSNLYALPSSAETFGIVVIEAMATGLPVLSTRCVGPEKIIPKFAGDLIPINDINALRNGMEQIYLNIDSYQPKQIRQHVLDNFQEKVVVEKLKKIYQSVLEEGRLTIIK